LTRSKVDFFFDRIGLASIPFFVDLTQNKMDFKMAETSYLEDQGCLRGKNLACSTRFMREHANAQNRPRHLPPSEDTALVPTGIPLPALLDDFHAREILHVTFGSELTQYSAEIKAARVKHADMYQLAEALLLTIGFATVKPLTMKVTKEHQG
jgi:hypothetical protein